MTAEDAGHERRGASGAPSHDNATAPAKSVVTRQVESDATSHGAFTLLQSEWWARVRLKQGWARLDPREEARTLGEHAAPLVLSRPIGPLRFAYAPHAFAASPSRDLAEACEALRNIGRKSRIGKPHIIRWDVPWSVEAFDRDEARRLGLVPAARVQPPDTVVIELSPDEDTLLGNMKSKTRYNVRLAAKKGVVVKRVVGAAALAALPEWYRLYQVTARRDRIAIHPERYYRDVVGTAVAMREAGEPAPSVALYSAYHESDLLVGVVVVSWDGVSTYLYGASSDRKRNLMASYLIQWEAIRAARLAGDAAYDLFGIPPSDDPGHPMHGLYRFKTGFGGRVVHRPGCWDLSPSPIRATLFRTAERTRIWYHHGLRKRVRRG